jgi:hypothetical protein
MVAGMSSSEMTARRAKRLLLWYPKGWRERYGEEFADHLEQESLERPLDIRCVVNIARKGIVARFGDFGFASAPLSADGQTRAAVGTSFLLVTLVAPFMLNSWSLAMLRWSARTYHPIPVSATTGVLTVITSLLMLVLLVVVLVVVGSVVRQITRGRFRPLAVPTIVAACSGAFLLYANSGVSAELYRYFHGYRGRPGFGWTHPGSAIAAVAQTTFGQTQSWISLWHQLPGDRTSIYVMADIFPIAVVLFALSMASLWRRVELPHFVERISSAAVSILAALVGVFLLTSLAWLGLGGPSGDEAFVPEGARAGSIYLVILGFVVVLVTRTRWVAKGNGDIAVVSQS